MSAYNCGAKGNSQLIVLCIVSIEPATAPADKGNIISKNVELSIQRKGNMASYPQWRNRYKR